MKIKQTHKTAAICGAFIAIWMISGSLVEEENFKILPERDENLNSSVTKKRCYRK